MKNTCLFIVALALGTGAFAQVNPSQPAPATTAAAPAAIDPARLALARDVITAMKADKMFNSMIGQIKQMAAQNIPLPPNATPEQRKKAEALMGKIMDLSMDSARGLIAQMDQIYAAVYSEEELKAMKAFFSTPEGQSMLEKQPQIMTHIMPMVQKMQQDLFPKIQKLVEEAKAEDAQAAQPAAAIPAPKS